MQMVGSNPQKYIQQYSNDFKRDFVQLLRTSHGEKSVHINRFYQNYIANKEHVHLNSTRWQSLTEFAKFAARENICRVTEEDDNGQPGIYIAWINNDPAALRRNEASKRKDRQDKGDEEREAKAIQEQIDRAQAAQREKTDLVEEEEGEKLVEEEDKHLLEREEGTKIALNFGIKPKEETTESETKVPAKPKNIFAVKKKEAKAKKPSVFEAPKKMSEAERIMKSEIERKRRFEESGSTSAKRQRS
jgi:DNA/RNA-binding protein KIN17